MGRSNGRRNRVVVTGIGVIAPNGVGLQSFWKSILAGQSGIGPITLFDAQGFKSRIAGEVKDFNPNEFIEPELKSRRMARHTQFAYAATKMALNDAGLEMAGLPSPTPVVVGVSMNAMDLIERAFEAVQQHGPNRVATTTSAASIPQAPAAVIADRIGACANAITVSAACPSGLDAVADAAAMIRLGEADIAICGGTDAPITPLVMSSFIASGLCGEWDGDPKTASRPFDSERQSGVLSEGACIFVLENIQHAEARGAKIYLEIGGYAKRRDDNPTRPGCGLVQSMIFAMANAEATTDSIDYISAYGPSDRLLDAAEVAFIKEVFGQRAYQIPVSSIKGVTGNPLAAGGPFQLAACALSIRDQEIAPTANYKSGDSQCDLDFVPHRSRKIALNRALINVRGIGGSASTMVVNRVLEK